MAKTWLSISKKRGQIGFSKGMQKLGFKVGAFVDFVRIDNSFYLTFSPDGAMITRFAYSGKMIVQNTKYVRKLGETLLIKPDYIRIEVEPTPLIIGDLKFCKLNWSKNVKQNKL